MKHKGKISRMLAAKISLATRVDSFGEEVKPTLGIEAKAKVQMLGILNSAVAMALDGMSLSFRDRSKRG